MRAPRPIKEFCECGAGITLVGRDDDGDLRLLTAWRMRHRGFGHEERVTAAEANEVRHVWRERRNRKEQER